jgi:GT2 family glycosyltransferase
MRPKVAIVVLNWNGYEYTKECIASLERITYPNYEIIIVDNGSTDGSPQRLAGEFSRHKVILNEANLGFARGCNIGLRHALAGDADYLLLVNNDSIVEKGFLEPAVDALEADPAIGLVTGKIYFRDIPNQIWHAGGRSHLLRGLAVSTGRGQPDTGQFNRRREIDFATGALMLIRRSVLEEVGLLPEEYFFGQEDWDYCTTLRRRGYKLCYIPEFVTHHKPRGSHSAADAKYVYSFQRGRLIFLSKFQPRVWFAVWRVLFRFYRLLVMHRRLAHVDERTLAAYAFAMRCAVRDHQQRPRGPVTEQDLLRFEAEFQERFAPAPAEKQPAPCGT